MACAALISPCNNKASIVLRQPLKECRALNKDTASAQTLLVALGVTGTLAFTACPVVLASTGLAPRN